jgi:hypothetical protein
MDSDIYIGVGLSALLGWTSRAMREPSECGPGTELAPRFFMYVSNLNLLISAEVAGHISIKDETSIYISLFVVFLDIECSTRA